MLRTVMDKVDSMPEQMRNASWALLGNPNKEVKKNARDQKHHTRNEECFWWAY